MERLLIIGMGAGLAEALMLLAAGNPFWVVFLGYAAAGSLALLAAAAMTFLMFEADAEASRF